MWLRSAFTTQVTKFQLYSHAWCITNHGPKHHTTSSRNNNTECICTQYLITVQIDTTISVCYPKGLTVIHFPSNCKGCPNHKII